MTFDRLCRFEAKGSAFVSLGDSVDTSTPQGRLFFTLVAAFAEFERSNEDLAAARARGRVGGRPTANPERLELAFRMYDAGTFTVAEICKQSGVSKSTLFKYLKARGSRQGR
ncbi:MAG: recombinase family protein [Eggerthellaceae bacterium]|nr:recombinase family protein [Eggerthellaceae bacterium]